MDAVLSDNDRAAVVTGAGKVLGAAFTTSFARRGARVLGNNHCRQRRAVVGRGARCSFARDGHNAVSGGHAVNVPGAAAAAFGCVDTLVLNAYALTLADEQQRDTIGVNVLMPYASTPMTAGSAVPDPQPTPESTVPAALWLGSSACAETCGSACKRYPLSGVIGVQ